MCWIRKKPVRMPPPLQRPVRRQPHHKIRMPQLRHLRLHRLRLLLGHHPRRPRRPPGQRQRRRMLRLLGRRQRPRRVTLRPRQVPLLPHPPRPPPWRMFRVPDPAQQTHRTQRKDPRQRPRQRHRPELRPPLRRRRLRLRLRLLPLLPLLPLPLRLRPHRRPPLHQWRQRQPRQHHHERRATLSRARWWSSRPGGPRQLPYRPKAARFRLILGRMLRPPCSDMAIG